MGCMVDDRGDGNGDFLDVGFWGGALGVIREFGSL